MLDCQGPLAQLPADCSPSPRTAARSQCSRFSTTNRFQPLPRLDECTRIESNHALLPAPHRTYPISHYPTEVPFCEACRQQDAELQSAAELKSPSPVGLPSSDDDDASRSWIFKQLPGPWWWCEDCQASVTSPEITIPHLFAVLRQWTPYAQLQLITIVEEIFRRGAHVDDRDGLTDMTLLHFAAKSGAVGDEESALRVAEFLLDGGACLEARCKWTDMTPLHYAAYYDCPMMVELFLRRGAHLEARSRLMDNATALHFAASQLSLGAARVLLHASAHSLAQGKDAVDAANRTPYECLPPVAQLAEPLCSLRDRLAELLGPPVKSFDFAVTSVTEDLKQICASTSEAYLPRHPSHTRGQFQESGNVDAESLVAAHVDPRENLLMPTSSEPPTTQSNGGLNWLVAESGFLSPRNRRSVVSPPNAPSTPGKSLTTRTTRQTVVNHPLPQTSSVSAKVTLQSLGLALDDFVCIGPGCTTDSINPDGSSAAVTIGSRIGRLRYCGPVEFASGIWVGVELEKPLGRNNGSVSGVQYFNCAPSHGLFAPIGRVYKAVNEGSSQMWHPVHQSKRPPSAPRSRPPTPKQEHPGGTATSGTGDTSPRCFVPNSRSSYSLSSCPDSSQPRVTSPTNHPIDVSHVTAKVDTGLRTHSADKNGAPQLAIGNRVLVAGQRKGILRFIGPTQFAPGTWYGVELDQPLGKNNGSVSGVRYFQCPIGHGIFASRERIQRLPDRPSKSRDSPSALLKHHSSMSESFHGGEPDRRITTHGPIHRMAWSTTTSPMIGRAVVGRPTLPAELLKVLQNAVARSEQVQRASQEPAFYITEGMQVLCAGEIGTVRYIGPITFADGIWLGVELRKPRGRHDGSVAGKRYFHCRPGHGLLVRPSRVSCRGINAVNLLPPALAAMEQELMAKRQTPTEKRSQSDVASSDVSSVVASSSSSRRSSYKHSPT